MSRGQEGDAFPTVTLCAVHLVELGHMNAQAVTEDCQHPAESGCKQQAEEAVWSPLMEEVQSTSEAATQRELALDKEQIQTSAISILFSERKLAETHKSCLDKPLCCSFSMGL